MSVLFRPLVAWPHKATSAYNRKSWPSAKLTVARALDMVERELRLMGCGSSAYIEADVDEKHIRQDGELRSNAVTRSPGCIIYAKHRTLGDLRWACDLFTRLEFNIRAIAATIENLRAVDRYGCVRDAEQFRGFKAIPATTTDTLTTERALQILEAHSGMSLYSTSGADSLARAHRAARANTHPDRNDGRSTNWHAVEAAAKVLGLK